MSAFPWEVLVLALVLAINRLGTPMTYTRPVVFWGIQAANVALAVPAVLVGVPGMEAFPAVGWLIAGLLAFHVLQNLSLRSAALTQQRRERDERERIRKLRALGPIETGPSPEVRAADDAQG